MEKIKIELVVNENGITFLNYWDNLNGNDVCCEIKDGKLFEQTFVGNDHDLVQKEITLQDFVNKVKFERNKISDI